MPKCLKRGAGACNCTAHCVRETELREAGYEVVSEPYTPEDVRKLVEAVRFAVNIRRLEHSSPGCKDAPQSQWTEEGRDTYCTRCILGDALEPFKEVN